ncbi:MFS transporter [Microbacterium invictum]|uniref:MFS family permease n=1 Tax=Microbacterium invictum TaxID=515415 RepID=A0AA40VLV5_9MICO|nr:MFS transporter [Microbacterium invictum]MBB4138663.1 MFS family permease [Microbacterium invictum]
MSKPLDATQAQATHGTNTAMTRVQRVKGRGGGLMALAFASIVDGFEGGLVNTLFPVIRDALGLQTSALGILTAISRFARMLFGPVWASLADRFGRKKILFVATGLWGLWTVAAGFAQDPMQLFVLYSVGVIGTVASEPIVNGLIVDMYQSKERGRAFGTLRTLAAAASVVATPILGQFANIDDGWRYGMFTMGGISVLSGVLILLLVHEPHKHTPVGEIDPDAMKFNFKAAAGLLRTKTILFMSVQVVLTTSLVLFAFLITFFVDERGWTTADAAMLMSVYLVGALVSGLAGGFLGDWFERRFGPRGRVMMMQGYLVLYAVSTVLMFQIDWGHGIAVYVAMLVTGLLSSMGHPGAVLPIVGSVVPKAVVATAYALIFSFVQGLFAALFSLAFGFLADALGLQTLMFWLISVPYAANAMLWSVMYRIYPKDFAVQKARDAAIDAATETDASDSQADRNS